MGNVFCQQGKQEKRYELLRRFNGAKYRSILKENMLEVSENETELDIDLPAQ